ncbi:hypothetical protein BDF20DRAFT_847551 [Mycotypha africana]|uniref:uncharacterized protein n=1 Tax=Mycotypha africana TaxID=64632 RepID=UPI002301AECB|nr:uncharacterized protein BDF20DRAFT_847551 [Mycotypha africana]KAI8991967.1 hypothetical protein BDF20DRAFT_847551 [Mycotypha africana]
MEEEEPKIWLLGRAYSKKPLDKVQQAILDAQRNEMFKPRSTSSTNNTEREEQEEEQEEPECPSAWPPDFYEDFTSRLWMTYRHNYPPIRPSSHKTDIGWGCMLRSGQSLLANTLLIHSLSRDWRRQKQTPAERKQYGKIIQWFLDELSPRAPFSIHRIALLGKQLGKNIGEWFGPSTISQVLQALVSDFKPANLSVYIATDGVVYMDGIQDVTSGRKPRGDFSYFTSKIATSSPSSTTEVMTANPIEVMTDDISAEEAKHLYENSTPLTEEDEDTIDADRTNSKNNGTIVLKPVLILVALRLGIDSLHPTYYPALKACFGLPSFVGIAGGRPNSSLYFIGLDGDHLIYLDPHFSRAALETKNLKDYTRHDFNTYHCYLPRKIHISHLDPSMMLGFYCQTQKEFDQLREQISQISQHYTSIFSIEKSAPEYEDDVRSVQDFGVLSDEDCDVKSADDTEHSDTSSLF